MNLTLISALNNDGTTKPSRRTIANHTQHTPARARAALLSILAATAAAAMPCTSAFSASLPSYGNSGGDQSYDNVAPNTTIVVEDSQVTYSGYSGGDETKNSSSYSGSSNSGTTAKLTEQQQLAVDTKQNVLDTLNGYISAIERTMSSDDDVVKTFASAQNAYSITNMGTLDVPIDDFLSLCETAVGISDLGLDSVELASLGVTGGAGGASKTMSDMTVTTAQNDTVYTVEGGEGGAITAVEDGYDIHPSDYEGSDAEQIFNYIAGQDGSPFSTNYDPGGLGNYFGTDFDYGSLGDWFSTIPSFDIADWLTGLDSTNITWDPVTGVFNINRLDGYSLDGAANRHLNISDIRGDLVSGGLYDSENWIDRFGIYLGENGLSNATNEYITLALIDEYRLEDVTLDEMADIQFNHGSARFWEVTNNDTGETWTSWSSLGDIYMELPADSSYTFTPYQLADYTIGTYATYGKNQYLFDAATGNILMYKEAASVGTVCLSKTSYSNYVPSGGSITLSTASDALGGGTGYYSGIERVQ